MLSECTGPLNFTMFLSLFAEKYGSTDPESVILNAFSMFDPEETGRMKCKTFKNLLTTVGDRFSKDEVNLTLSSFFHLKVIYLFQLYINR
jgi:Ca2+-binding EF-hand superfamily protein